MFVYDWRVHSGCNEEGWGVEQRTRESWVVMMIAVAILAVGCSQLELADAGAMSGDEDAAATADTDGGDEDAASMSGDAGDPPDTGMGTPCMTGVFGTSTFDNACFGD